MKVRFGCAASFLLMVFLGAVRVVAGEMSDIGATIPAAMAAAAMDTPPSITRNAERPYIQPEFVGTYRPDGRFKKACKRSCFLQTNNDQAQQPSVRPQEVPHWIELHPVERVVQDNAPPASPKKVFSDRSAYEGMRNSFLTALYGREPVLGTPTHVTTDSSQRLIISDPRGPAVHVLDDKNSFRIAGGPGRRLQHPTGVAVDNDDNIYVADGKLGVVLVYDREGIFRRVLGAVHGESMFQNPTAIALDRQAGRLYVLDSPMHELIVLDLQGNLLKRVGGRRSAARMTFEYPSEIAVGNGRVVVLDSRGTRIQVLDSQCNFLNAFRIRGAGAPQVPEIGLALDRAGNIYVSHVSRSALSVYKESGEVIGSLGQFGGRKHEFTAASGAWVDANDRIYFTETANSRVQVFQLAAKARQR